MTHLEAKRQLLTWPGMLVQDNLDMMKMSQKELAERMGRSESKLNELIKGKAPITKSTAIKLSRIIGGEIEFWLNQEARYQSELFEIKRLEQLQENIEWLKRFPLKILKDLGHLTSTKKNGNVVEELLRFFKVGSPKEWAFIFNEASVAYKIELKHTAHKEAISVWLRLGEIEAEGLMLPDYDKTKVRKSVPKIKQLSYLHPSTWMKDLRNICSECGIALVFTSMIPKAPISGSARWIRNGQIPLIQVSSKFKNNYAFYFYFYHELAHILLHGKKDFTLKAEGVNGITKTLDTIKVDQRKEDEADNWAKKQIISVTKFNQLLAEKFWDVSKVLAYAKKHEIHPGIIVGLLARHGIIEYNRRDLFRLQEKVSF